MRRAVTFAVKGNKWIPIWDPGIPIAEQKAWLKRVMREGFNADSIFHWELESGTKREFRPPMPKVPVKALKRVPVKV